MNLIEEAIATLGIPGSIAVVMVLIFALLQLIGGFIEAGGKVAPALLNVRKFIKNRRKAKNEQAQTLIDVKTLLSDVNTHYSKDNISKRDDWMTWVNDRAVVYDTTIIEVKDAISELKDALNNNTKMTEKMFIESSRDRIISFASKVTEPVCYVSREEFNRIFKVYREYEEFLAERNMTNGEVDISYQIIEEAYRKHLAAHDFTEDLRNMTLSAHHEN